ncbi:cysteine desulfurase [Dehalococcoides mccartyi CG4]|uniref:aminotransferase class V-fold PLP-dependent enzyme n=1 Tax=Dehalococcoides mccartyi TaxID=61435 RepID=UPI0004E080B8|nr:aminotransferase class V-fold PLP-dependent enzyme [Dehalococcoides mccartyi]AII59478.1 cysteine desulfurase [Dehalococcoides mccartyi CG4]
MAYFDNAATTFPKPEEVYTFTDKFYREFGVNVGRGQHVLATKASSLVGETRQLLLELNHCSDRKVVFTHTATEALNTILRGMDLPSGSNVYVSPFEHNAVMRVLHYIGEQKHLNIKELELDRTNFLYDVEKIKYRFADNPPNLVIVSHASNVCGVIAPIKEIFALSKQYDVVNVVDMCQTMGLIDTDLSETNVDFAVFAGHKTLYGPFGIAGFICSSNANIKPLMFGGTGIDSASRTLPNTVPERYEVGSPNITAIAGLNAALKWINKVGIENILETERHNHLRLLEKLREFNNIKIISPINGENSVGVISCNFEGYESSSIGQVLSAHDVAVRTGLHCSPDAHHYLGTFPGGSVRFSVSYFNDENDFQILHNALNYIYENS